MSRPKTEQVISHIEDAQSWLARAKEDYRSAEHIRGELNLSLAQAEVKYAWELSRRPAAAAAPTKLRRARVRWGLPMAACLGLVLLAVVLASRLIVPSSSMEGPVARRAAPAIGREPRPHSQSNPPADTPVRRAPARASIVPEAGEAATPPASVETPAMRDPEISAPSPTPVDAAQVHPGGATPPPDARETAAPSPADDLHAASGGGLAFDLRELERVAQETLRAGEGATGYKVK